MFARNMALFMGAEVAALAIGLVTSPITTRLLTVEQYGSLALLAAVWSMWTILQFAGMDSAFIVFQARGVHDRENVRVTTTVSATVAATCVCSLFAVLGLTIPWLRNYASVTQTELVGFMLGLLPSTLVAWQLQLLRFSHEALRFARVTLVGRVASALIALPVMYLLPQEQRLAGAVYTAAALAWSSLLLAAWEVRSSVGNPFDLQKFDKGMVRPMLVFGLALIPGAMVYAACAVVDRLMLGWYAGSAEVAVFGLAAAVAGAALILKVAFSRTWDPHMMDWLATRDERVYLPRLQTAADLIAPVVLLLTLLALVWGETFFRLLFPAAYSGAGKLLPVLVLAGTLSTLVLVAIATETLSGKVRFRMLVYTAGLAVNAAACMLFIPEHGARAAAFAALAGEIVILALWIATGRWLLGNLRLRWSRPLVFLGVATGLCVLYQPGAILPTLLVEQLVVTLGCGVLAWEIYRLARKRLSQYPWHGPQMLTGPP